MYLSEKVLFCRNEEGLHRYLSIDQFIKNLLIFLLENEQISLLESLFKTENSREEGVFRLLFL